MTDPPPTFATNTLLALDTSTPYLALAYGPEALVREVGRQHAELLPAALDELLRGKKPSGVVVGIGPGSYTGVRVGASYALGLARAWGVGVRGVSTLESLVDAAQSGLQAVSLDARKGMVYGAIYEVEGGAVMREVLPPAKFEAADFETQAAGLPWRRDPVPDPVALALAGARHGLAEWQLQYL